MKTKWKIVCLLSFLFLVTISSYSVSTVFNETFNVATPAGTDDPQEADDRMREIKAATQERENVDHIWDKSGNTVDDADTGEHRKVTFNAALGADPAPGTGKGALYTKTISGIAELFWQDKDGAVLQLTTGGVLTDDIIDTAQLADDAVDADRIEADAVTTVKILDDNVTLAKVENDIVSGLCKAWVSFDATGNINGTGFNATVARNDTGDFTISFTAPFADADYAVTGMAAHATAQAIVSVKPGTSPAAGSVTVLIFGDDGIKIDPSTCMVMAFGDQ